MVISSAVKHLSKANPRPGTVVPPWKGPSISTFLEKLGKFDLLAYMNKYWINQGAPNADFWGHEFSKHGTCMSTYDTPCYGPSYVEHEDVVDFFESAILYYQRLPTWGWLSAANIRPSNSTNYTLSDFQSALTKGYGALPFLGCSGPRYNTTAAGAGSKDTGFTVLTEVWYYYNVRFLSIVDFAYANHSKRFMDIHAKATGSISMLLVATAAVPPRRVPLDTSSVPQLLYSERGFDDEWNGCK